MRVKMKGKRRKKIRQDSLSKEQSHPIGELPVKPQLESKHIEAKCSLEVS